MSAALIQEKLKELQDLVADDSQSVIKKIKTKIMDLQLEFNEDMRGNCFLSENNIHLDYRKAKELHFINGLGAELFKMVEESLTQYGLDYHTLQDTMESIDEIVSSYLFTRKQINELQELLD